MCCATADQIPGVFIFTSDRPVDGRQHHDHRADVNIKEYGNASAMGA